jgi:choline dehydrogenase-like flavoprotein
VAVRDDHRLVEIGASRVVLSAGAYGSPAILLRSGIGPAIELAAIGLKPSLDLPGVGRNLHDQPWREDRPVAARCDVTSPWRRPPSADSEPHLLTGHAQPGDDHHSA